MTNLAIIQPDGWPAPCGYSNAICSTGRTISLSGQIGWNPVTGEIESTDFAAQVGQALRNVVTILDRAGAGPEHLVRMTWFVTDRDKYMEARAKVGELYRAIIGRHYPAMSVVIVNALIEHGAHVEIEATAVVPQ
ncbi:MAG: RidA family protein [Gemmatimonadaceae bacterium]